jgi:putative transposase
VRKVWHALRRWGRRVSRKRVWALMHAEGVVLAPEREPGGPPSRGHVVTPEPNRRWATDLTTGWTRRDGWVAVVPTIACGCRSVLALAVTQDQSAPAILRAVDELLGECFGAAAAVPDGLELRTDHGPPYTGQDCADLGARWGLEPTLAPVGRPTGNAVVERVIRTMKEECVWLQDWESADALAVALAAWRRRYNETRPPKRSTGRPRRSIAPPIWRRQHRRRESPLPCSATHGAPRTRPQRPRGSPPYARRHVEFRRPSGARTSWPAPSRPDFRAVPVSCPVGAITRRK